MKTAGLIDTALDWAVTKCEGFDHEVTSSEWGMWGWATDWAQGGPIIEREGINLVYQGDAHDWNASLWDYAEQDWHLHTEGPTPLVAAMRCRVASKLGDEIDVPKELQP